MQRRAFLKWSSLGAMGLSLEPSALLGEVGNGFQKEPAGIAVQLYTVRKELEKDPAGTLRRIADMGYPAVETAFWPENISLQQAGRWIREAGLRVTSAHVELPIGDKQQAFLEAAEAYQCNKMIWHGWPEDIRYGSLDGVKQLAAIYNEAHRFASAHGLQFGLHNHWWEFRNKMGRRYVYQILLRLLDPAIFFEIDTYWVKVAGHDPADIIKKFGKRAPLLHIKDGSGLWHDSLLDDYIHPMVPAGKGSQDFPAIVKAADGNTEWMIVEMDKTDSDVFLALQESYDYLVKNGLAKGNK